MEFGVVGQLQNVRADGARPVCEEHGSWRRARPDWKVVKLVVVVCFAPVLWGWSNKDNNMVVSNTAVTSQCEWLIPFPLLSDWKNDNV
jgi:hypothetical protein